MIAKLKSAGVTSVILAGDPVFPTFLTKEATAQDYFPEWVVLGYAFTDTAVFGRQYDQEQWAHAFGVSLLPARTADDVDELGNLITWQTGHPPTAKTFRELVQAPLIFFTGVHLAGPAAHREDVRAPGSSASRPPPTTTPTRLHLSWGRHDIWKGVDLTGGDDATVIWWDPDATGPDEVGRDGTGPLPLRRRRHALPPRAVAERRRSGSSTPQDVDRPCSTELPARRPRRPSYPSPAAG